MVFEQGQRGEAIPIFIYHEPTQWEYVGDYLCVALEHDPILLRQKILAYPRRVAIAGLLRFKKV